MTRKLHRLGTSRIPLFEVSALSTMPGSDAVTLVALGDDQVSIAVCPVDRGGDLGEWTVLSPGDLGAPPRGIDRFGQLEAVALDGAGRAWVLTEGTSLIGGIDLAARTPVAVVSLDTSTIPQLHESWSASDASRGEGLLLLTRGHVLVAKEKDPVGLVEFGPVGDSAQGVSDLTMLGVDEPFATPSESIVALAWWPWPYGDQLEDLSDIAVDGERGVWLLSDQSRCLAPLRLPLLQGSDPVIGAVLRLPRKLDKPEGLAFLPGGIVAVADDRHDQDDNLWLLQPRDT